MKKVGKLHQNEMVLNDLNHTLGAQRRFINIYGRWKNFTKEPKALLRRRFGCDEIPIRVGKRTVPSDGILINVKKFKDLKNFRLLLGYINTSRENEKKIKDGQRG